MARQRFSLAACGSSRGGYVARAHEKYISEHHKRVEGVVLQRIVKPKYYTRCWGRLFPITEVQAAMLKPTKLVIVR